MLRTCSSGMRTAIVFAVLLVAACSSTDSAQNPPQLSTASPSSSAGSNVARPLAKACPTTAPNGWTPPGEAPSKLDHGNGRLWTILWPGGLVLVPPDHAGRDGSLEMKFPWWRGPGVHGRLHIRGHELTLGVPVRADTSGYGDTGFNASGIVFPVAGCYEITGEVDGATLTFVTRVEPCSAISELPASQRKSYSICRP
jgi:hypothetical protein